MVEKTEVIDGWPLETGDYAIGDTQCPVAVVTLGSKMNEEVVNEGAAIAGPLHTENLGIEKVVSNIVSNPNIRFLIICGSEVQGHITGETVKALYENGIDPDTKSIIGSPGAIPFVENLPIEAVERFQEQLTIIDMINNENLDEISKKISECIEEDPGCFEKEPMIVQLNEKEEEEEEVKSFEQENISASSIDSSSLYLLGIENRIRSMKLEINEIGSFEKFSSGYYAGKIQGIVIGFILTLVLVMILFWSLRL
ncbi:MAG: tetrahydromethanopterin S-methyltransferase subunit A [Methanosphaera stadtmanae]|jgi:tetrahydromethanopterin S-methyltransferase subunit A|nr:tetrahydromethanopterin S-methyltransferase subunit A [Methanosphaera stadtmanae]